jgi:hypothetical protein
MVVDSGESPSYVCNKDMLTNIKFETNSANTAEKGQALVTIGEGLLKLPGITIPNVTICPTMGLNLISVSSICDLGHTVTFTKTSCTVNQKNPTILTAHRTGGLYTFYAKQHQLEIRSTCSSRTHF